MTVNIAINGFGRIGRQVFRQIFRDTNFNITVINDISSPKMIAYLLKYDTTQGSFPDIEDIFHRADFISVNGRKFSILNKPNVSDISWAEHSVDIVVDCSGAYLSKEKAAAHLRSGAKKVLLSAPAGEDVPTIVYGVNEHILKPESTIISAASCSTNALALMVKVLHEYAPILSGMMTVVHGFTANQMLVDNPHRKGDLRRSRAAGANIIPTTAEAAKATGMVIPELKGKLAGSAFRVPVLAGCIVNFVAQVQGRGITEKTVNKVMKESSSDVFGYTEEEIVSSDIIGTRFASLFDATQTIVNQTGFDSSQVRLATWFDNESSYASQMVRCLSLMV
jgi:glyceraldehyde 3-phosphate dehydrogenase